jgi:hypothetical protein
MFSDFCRTANTIAATTKKSEKERLLADYFVSLDDASLERAAVFFSGSPFPRKDQRAAGVGGAALSDALVAHLREDKTVDQISTIDEVRRIYEGQLKRKRQE